MERHVKIVWGPPCAGKSTYCKNHLGEKDVVWDSDEMSRALHYGQIHDQPEYLRALTFHLLDEIVYFLGTEKGPDIKTFWFITRRNDNQLCKKLDAYAPEYIEIAATLQECLDHLEADDSRPDKSYWENIIRGWFDEHGKDLAHRSALLRYLRDQL